MIQFLNNAGNSVSPEFPLGKFGGGTFQVVFTALNWGSTTAATAVLEVSPDNGTTWLVASSSISQQVSTTLDKSFQVTLSGDLLVRVNLSGGVGTVTVSAYMF